MPQKCGAGCTLAIKYMTASSNHHTAASTGDPSAPGDVPTPEDFRTASQSLLRYFFGTLHTVAQLLRRYALLIIALAVLGAGLAWVYRMVVAPRYVHSMLLQCNGASRTAYTQVFQQLNSMAQVEEGAQLTALTGMPPASAQKIIWVRTSFPDALPANDDSTIIMVHRMLVQVRTTEKELNKQFQPLLLRFVNAAPFLRTAKQTEVAAVKEELSFIEKQLSSLDSLHRSFNAALAKGGAVGQSKDGLNAASTYQHALELQKEKGRLQTWLAEQNEPVSVIVPFYLFKAPMRMLWWVLVGAAAGAALGILLALLQWLKHWSTVA